MNSGNKAYQELILENHELRKRLEEAEMALKASSGKKGGALSTCQPAEPFEELLQRCRLDLSASSVSLGKYERDLQTTLERFYTILSNMYSGVLLVADDGRVEFANQAFCDHFGLNNAPADLIGLDAPAIIGKIREAYRYPDEAINRIYETLEEGRPVKGEEIAMKGGRTCLRDFLPLIVDGKSYGRLWLHYDITEQKQTEEALRESEERLRRLGDNLPDSAVYTYIKDADGTPHFLYMSSGIERLNGVKVLDVLRDANILHRQILPECFGLMIKAEDASAKDLTDFTAEVQMRRLDGEIRWMHLRSRPRRLADGRVAWDGVQTDVTDRRKAEETLTKYRLLAENARDVILFVRRDGQITEANNAAVRMYGYSRDELLRLNILDLRVTEPAVKIEEQMAVADSEGILFESRHRRKDESLFDVEVSSRGMDIDGERVLLSVIRDISDRKRAEWTLRLSEEKFALAFANNPAAIALTRLEDGVFLDVNDTWTSLSEWGREEAIGRSARMMNIWPKVEDAARFVEELKQKGRIRSWEQEFLTKSGRPYVVQLSAEILIVQGEEVILSTMVDIRERKHAEAALRESEERFRVAQELSPDGFTIFRPVRDEQGHAVDFVWVYENAAIARMNGTIPSEVIGKRLLEVFPGHRGSRFLEVYQQVADTGEPQVLEESYHGDSITELTWFRIVVVSMANDIAALAQDITTQRRAQQALAEARANAEMRAAEMESWISSMSDGVIFFDNEGKGVMISEAGKAILEVPAGEQWNDWSNYQRLSLEDGSPIATTDTPSFRALAGDILKDFRYRVITPTGKDFIMSTNASPVRDPEGRIVGAVAIFNDVTDKVAFEQWQVDMLSRERHITEALQGSLVPQKLPDELYDCQVASRYQPALNEAEVGGDFFDVFDLGAGKLALMIGDVAGKGLKAAVRVAQSRYSMRSYAFEDPDPSRVFTRTNELLCKDGFDEGNMLTAFLAIVDTASGIVSYANAGHEAPVVIKPDGTWSELGSTGLPLGVLSGAKYDGSTVEIAFGDKIVMVTDGIVEARSKACGMFEKQGMIDYLIEHRKDSPAELTRGLLGAALNHSGGKLQDDAALLAFERRNPENAGDESDE